MDLSVRAYAINVDLNIASKRRAPHEAFARKEKEPCGFVMKDRMIEIC